jgi:hypothetical protein
MRSLRIFPPGFAWDEISPGKSIRENLRERIGEILKTTKVPRILMAKAES